MTDDIERPRPGRRPSFDKTALHALFMERLPEFRKTANLIDRDRLSEALGIAPFSLTRWMVLGTVSIAGYRRIIKLGEGRIDPEELLPFLAGMRK